MHAYTGTCARCARPRKTNAVKGPPYRNMGSMKISSWSNNWARRRISVASMSVAFSGPRMAASSSCTTAPRRCTSMCSEAVETCSRMAATMGPRSCTCALSAPSWSSSRATQRPVKISALHNWSAGPLWSSSIDSSHGNHYSLESKVEGLRSNTTTRASK